MAHHLSHEIKVYGDIKLYAGTGSPELAQKISDYLQSPLCGRDVIEFPNENLFIKLHGSVRGQDVYVIQQTAIECASQPDGTAHHDPDPAPGLGRAHHSGSAVPGVWPLGQEGPAACADYGAPGGRYDRGGRCRPLYDSRSACRADPGIFHHTR